MKTIKIFEQLLVNGQEKFTNVSELHLVDPDYRPTIKSALKEYWKILEDKLEKNIDQSYELFSCTARTMNYPIHHDDTYYFPKSYFYVYDSDERTPLTAEIIIGEEVH